MSDPIDHIKREDDSTLGKGAGKEKLRKPDNVDKQLKAFFKKKLAKIKGKKI